jgi:hypothetical protein
MVNDLELLAAKVEAVVDDLKVAEQGNKELRSKNKKLEQQIASLEKDVGKSQKEGEKTTELIAQNKKYKKKFGLMKTRVTSMLAKIESLQ